MNAPALVRMDIPALQMAESELIAVMQNSVYPGAKLESIKLALGYCKAQGLDPMTKPVHIVPMNVKVKGPKGAKDTYEDRDVIMPGIELYRTKAARTGEYAGCSEPEFGPPQKISFKEKKWVDNADGSRSEKWLEGAVLYPEWCRVTVRRLVDGHIVEFTAIEFWDENYATQGRDSEAPNAMWKKRPRGQIAKCAEAQALRKGFPEVGALPTAEELTGKTIDETGSVVDEAKPVAIPGPQAKSQPAAEEKKPATIEGESKRETDAPKTEGAEAEKSAAADNPMPEGPLRILRAQLGRAALSDADLIAKFGPVEKLKFGQFEEIKTWIAERGQQVAGK